MTTGSDEIGIAGIPLLDEGYYYLGSPYSKYPTGMENAFKEVCIVASVLLSSGIRVFSPIAHSHPIAMMGNIDPTDHGIWMWADRGLMEGAEGLIVAKMESWKNSKGLMEEIDYFEKAGKPVYMLELGDVGL